MIIRLMIFAIILKKALMIIKILEVMKIKLMNNYKLTIIRVIIAMNKKVFKYKK